MPKSKSVMSVESDRKKRKVITLDMKFDIIKRFDNGQSKASICRALGLNESTVRLIVSKSNEYKEQGKVASTSLSIRCTRNRSSILVEMENLLITWLEDCNQKRTPIGTIGREEKEEIASEGEGCVSKEIFIKELEQMFRNLETVKQQIMDLDPNLERSMLVG
jgi:transposase-like protein